MCKRQAGVKLNDDEKGLEGLVDDITEDHARLILDRLELLSKAREIIKHPKLEENIKLCENNLDTPDWWISGKHDRELLRAVLKYGIYRSEQLILADPEFPFYESAKKYLQNLEIQIQLQNQQLMKMQAAKAEAAEKAELAVKLEKSDASLKIEKVPIKRESSGTTEERDLLTAKETGGVECEAKVEVKAEDDEVKMECEEVKAETEQSDATLAEIKPEVKHELSDDKISDDDDEHKMEIDEDALGDDKQSEDDTKEKDIELSEEPKADKEQEAESMEVDTDNKSTEEHAKKDTEKQSDENRKTSDETELAEKDITVSDNDALTSVEAVDSAASKQEDKDAVKKPELERESSPDVIILDEQKIGAVKPKVLSDEEKCSKQAAELKARFPDLEVFQPLMKLKQLDNSVSKEDFKSKFY